MKKTIMQKKLLVFTTAVVVLGLSLQAANAVAQYDINSLLGGKVGDFFHINGALFTDSLQVGYGGGGGVSYLNGTIINNTPFRPVTFGDDVRIDGALWRGETAGASDGLPLKINDDAIIYGELTLNGGITGLSSADFSDNANLAKLNQDLNLARGKMYKINGSQISSSDLSDAANLAKLNQDLSLASGKVYQINGVQISTSNLSDASNIALLNNDINLASGKMYKIDGSQISSSDLSDVSNIGLLDQAATVAGAWTFGSGMNIATGQTYKVNGTQISSDNLSDVASIAMLDEAETIAGDWVNTASPWADNEVANDLTIASTNVMTVANAIDASGGNVLALNQTTADAASGSRSVLSLATSGTSSSKDYFIWTSGPFKVTKDGALNVADASITSGEIGDTNRKINLPLFSWYTSATNPVTLDGSTTPNTNTLNNYRTIEWSTGETTQFISNVFTVPSDWSGTNNITLLINCALESAGGGSPDTFSLNYYAANDGENTSPTVVNVTAGAPASTNIATIGLAMSSANLAAGDVVRLDLGFTAIDQDIHILNTILDYTSIQ